LQSFDLAARQNPYLSNYIKIMEKEEHKIDQMVEKRHK
jgi:hypothetical protein